MKLLAHNFRRSLESTEDRGLFSRTAAGMVFEPTEGGGEIKTGLR